MSKGNSGLFSGTIGTQVAFSSTDYMKSDDNFSMLINDRKDIDTNEFYNIIAHEKGGCIEVQHNGRGVMMDYRVAITSFESCETDTTIYHLYLSSAFKATLNALKLIAKITDCNYMEAKKLVENAPSEIFHGKAIEVKKFKEILESANIKVYIEPEFPY